MQLVFETLKFCVYRFSGLKLNNVLLWWTYNLMSFREYGITSCKQIAAIYGSRNIITFFTTAIYILSFVSWSF